jgi:hypothetical protein
VERHDPAAGRAAFCENVLKHHNLTVPVAPELRTAVKADLAGVASLGQKAVAEWHFILPLVSQFEGADPR